MQSDGDLVDGGLTAGRFQAMTGLTAKALRLYAERGILVPASVDPVSGYRSYARSQLRHGLTVDLLRRAQVPLAELARGSDFSFEDRRLLLAVRRQQEDFLLDVAERVVAFDVDDLTAVSTPAPPLDWVGVVVELAVPADAEDQLEAFAALSVDVPEVEAAFVEALADVGAPPAELTWTAAPDTSLHSGSVQLVLARAGHGRLDGATRDVVAAAVRAATGNDVTVLTGTLPHRVEVTFPEATPEGATPVEEAAAGYLQLLAFEHHLATHDLTAASTAGRQVAAGGTLFSDEPGSRPLTVFDVRPPSTAVSGRRGVREEHPQP